VDAMWLSPVDGDAEAHLAAADWLLPVVDEESHLAAAAEQMSSSLSVHEQ